MSIPVVDISSIVNNTSEKHECARKIGDACREFGFFYIVGHGVDEKLQSDLEEVVKKFFAQPLEVKNEIRMELAGAAIRGFFPVRDQLTSGKPDIKSGLYFGEEFDDDHPAVKAKIPLFGKNLFPENIPEMKEIVHEYIKKITDLGHVVMRGIASSLGLQENYFYDNYTKDPIQLLRIFNYPVPEANIDNDDVLWGVGEHTDYGLITILKQDDCGGLEVKSKSNWIDAPPIDNSFVCNIGDMLDRLTRGLYRSTPHRVRYSKEKDRFSFPFFFDPNFYAEVKPIEGITQAICPEDDKEERWDKSSVHEVSGIYGDYIIKKIHKIFPKMFMNDA